MTDNHKPYKQRKVRILNGAHDAFFHGHTLTEDGLIGDREGNSYTIKDERTVLEFYYADDNVHAVCICVLG